MSDYEKTVFICYRRSQAPWALAIFQHLTHHGYDVFFDFMGIASGDFERVILDNIEACAHFLPLLTPSSLEKCHHPGDWMRREIEAAIRMKRNVVPLMLDGFDFSAPGIAEQLTGPMSAIKGYNALRVPVEYFEEAMARLRDRFLNVAVGGAPPHASPAVRRMARDQQTAAKAEPAVQQEELTAQAYFERAYQATDTDEKLRFYTWAIRLNPDYSEAFNNRGLLRREQGDLAGALEDYEVAIRLNPKFARAFNNRGTARNQQGDLAGAREDYDAAIRLQPDYPITFFNRGLLRKQQGDLIGALADLGAYIRLTSNDYKGFLERSRLRRAQGDLAGATQDWNTAKRLNPALTGALPRDA